MLEKNVLIKIEYDGSGFSGWQKQTKNRSVQSEIEKALSFLCKQEIKINGTGRTDAGVHAYGQCATFSGTFGIPVERIPLVINKILPEDIRIKEAIEVPMEFHARYSAIGKKYIYKISTKKERDLFSRNYEYFCDKELDISLMRKGAAYLLGEHDFRSFMSTTKIYKENTVRTIKSIKLIDDEADVIKIEVVGNGFLYNMVRIIVGTLCNVGSGKIIPEYVKEIIERKDRDYAGYTAPPQGLYMAEIYFDDKSFKF